MTFLEFVQFNPYRTFYCRICKKLLAVGADVKLFLIFTYSAIAISLYLTIPIIYEGVHSHPAPWGRFLLNILIPLPAIALQIVLLFVPVSVYTWKWGKLRSGLKEDAP